MKFASLQGKTAFITGANTGIGRVTAIELAALGANVILACRSEEKTRPVLETIRSSGGRADFLQLDLSDLSNVRKCAQNYLAREESLSILINNAGVAGVRGLTKDGFELTFGVNHLGPYLLTRLLIPAMEWADHARIVTVASRAHYRSTGFDWNAVRKPTQSSTGLSEYSTSKLANILFSRELVHHLPTKNIHTYALHPGLVASDIWRRLPWGVRHLSKLFMLSNEEGAKTSIYCAASDEVREQTGLYYDKCKPKEPSVLALDDALAGELWDRSAAWVGIEK